ncbi:hypothetical protein NIA69_03465 [Gemmiger formicilis]|nr:hypothetical protein [Gemmiger formicilis]
MPGPYRVIIPRISTLLKKEAPTHEPHTSAHPDRCPPAHRLRVRRTGTTRRRHNLPSAAASSPAQPSAAASSPAQPDAAASSPSQPAAETSAPPLTPKFPVGHLLTLPQNQNSGPVWNTGDALYELRDASNMTPRPSSSKPTTRP